MTASEEKYTMTDAYRLGDKYKSQLRYNVEHSTQCYFAAKGCYTLATITDHEENNQQCITPNKLLELEQLKQQRKIIITTRTNTNIPLRFLYLLKAFYAPWLGEIKESLKKRCGKNHLLRETCLIAVYQQVAGNRFDVTSIERSYLQQHRDYIDKWEGPEFQKLTLRTRQNKMTDCLSVVYDKKGYYKRCHNSQEEWFKKYDGGFLAHCIKRAGQLFGTMIALKAEFGWKLLNKMIKFPKSKETYLIPDSWLFCGAYSSLLIALTDLLNVDKTPFKGSADKQRKRQQLMSMFQRQFDINSQQNQNDEGDMKDDHDGLKLQIPSNSLIPPTQYLSTSHTVSPYTSSPYTSSSHTSTSLSDQIDNGWPNMQSQQDQEHNNALHYDDDDDDDHIEEFGEIENDMNLTTNISSVPQSPASLFNHTSQQYMNGNHMYTSSAMIYNQRNEMKMRQLTEENETLKREMCVLRQMLHQQQHQQQQHHQQQHQQQQYRLNACNNANNGNSHQIQQIQSNHSGYTHQQIVNYGRNNHNVNNGNISSDNGQHQHANNNPNIVSNNNYNHQTHSNHVYYAHQRMINYGASNSCQYQQHTNNNLNIISSNNYNRQITPTQSHHVSYSHQDNHNINHGNISSDNSQNQQYANDNQRINHHIQYESMSTLENGPSFPMSNQNNSHHIHFNEDDDDNQVEHK